MSFCVYVSLYKLCTRSDRTQVINKTRTLAIETDVAVCPSSVRNPFVAMAARAAKLRKLDEFRRRLPHVSQSALHAVLKAVELEGVPELCNRWQMQ